MKKPPFQVFFSLGGNFRDLHSSIMLLMTVTGHFAFFRLVTDASDLLMATMNNHFSLDMGFEYRSADGDRSLIADEERLKFHGITGLGLKFLDFDK